MPSNIAESDMHLKHTDPAGQRLVGESETQLNAHESDIHSTTSRDEDAANSNADAADRSDDHATSISDPVSQSARTAPVSTNDHADGQQTPGQQLTTAPQINSLDVDSNWDTDSAIGSDHISSTTSVRSSIYAYIEENGRHYHRFKEGKYYLPNDEMEQDRLDLQHHLFLLTLDGKLHLAPIEDMKGGIQNVLDIATGTGIWAIDFATIFPSAKVIGCDLSAIQPQYVPANCQFEIDDVEDEWLYSQKFDYIHGRMLASCFNSHLTVFRSAFEALRPGGWFEIQDFAIPYRCIDDTMKGSAMERWLEAVLAAARKLGKDFGRVPNYKSYLIECGFVDVVETQLVWPIGTWPRDKKMKMLGAWCKEDVLSGLQGWSMAVLTRGLGMSPNEVELLLMEVRNDINSKKLHAYIPIYIVYGRKPE